jgi:hypothetical protein
VGLKLNTAGKRAIKRATHHRLNLKLTLEQTGPGGVRNLTPRTLTVKR